MDREPSKFTTMEERSIRKERIFRFLLSANFVTISFGIFVENAKESAFFNRFSKALTIRYLGGGGVYRIDKNNRALKFFEKNN